MTPERYLKVKAVVQAAMELPAPERTVYLDQACAGDDELRRETDALLAHDAEAAAFLEQPAFSPVGTTLGRYPVVEEIDRGGMGVVYLGRDTHLGRDVAIKLLPPAFAADPDRVRRFEREVRALSALNHPNIVTILEVGEARGLPYIVTELVEGETLRRRLAHGPLAEPEAVEIALQVAGALGAAHAAGIVHRDLKPENIMLRRDGYVKLLDFGLAKVTAAGQESDAGRTTVGAVTGTLRYMAPEQARGLAADARADIFSLGVVLYEMFSGRTPFERENPADAIVALLEKPPAPLNKPHLDRTLAKALAKRPEERYQSMAEFAGALREQRTETRRRGRRWRWVAGAALALGACAVAWLGLGHRRAMAEFRLGPAVRVTTTGDVIEAAISPDGAHAAIVREQKDGEALEIRRLQDLRVITELPAARVSCRGRAFSPDGRFLYFRNGLGRAPIQSIRLEGGEPRQVTWADSGVAFAPGGKRIAFTRGCALLLSNPDGSGEQTLATQPPEACFTGAPPAWAPDGDSIACAARRPGGVEIVLFAARDGSRRRLPPRRWTQVSSLAWMSDGRTLMLAANDTFGWPSQLWRFSPATGEARVFLPRLEGYEHAGLSGGWDKLITVSDAARYSLWVVPRDDPDRARQLVFGRAMRIDPTWTSAGDILYAAHTAGQSDLWTIPEGMKGYQPGATGFPASCGSYTVFTSTRTGVPAIWRSDPDGRRPVLLSGNIPAMKADCSPDGRWVVFESEPPGSLWKVPTTGGDPVRVLSKSCRRPVVSRDGKWIACSYSENLEAPERVALIPFEGGEPVLFLDLPMDAGTYARWSPDSHALTYIRTVEGASNIWSQAISGGAPRQMTVFSGGRITDFAWSSDGRLVCARGRQLRDAVVFAAGR